MLAIPLKRCILDLEKKMKIFVTLKSEICGKKYLGRKWSCPVHCWRLEQIAVKWTLEI